MSNSAYLCSRMPSTESMRMFASTFTNIIGAVILIAIVLPWFLIAVFVIMFVYILAANFYRASARELKVCEIPTSTLELCLIPM